MSGYLVGMLLGTMPPAPVQAKEREIIKEKALGSEGGKKAAKKAQEVKATKPAGPITAYREDLSDFGLNHYHGRRQIRTTQMRTNILPDPNLGHVVIVRQEYIKKRVREYGSIPSHAVYDEVFRYRQYLYAYEHRGAAVANMSYTRWCKSRKTAKGRDYRLIIGALLQNHIALCYKAELYGKEVEMGKTIGQDYRMQIEFCSMLLQEEKILLAKGLVPAGDEGLYLNRRNYKYKEDRS